MSRPSTHPGASDPSQGARLLWFLAFFLAPMAGLAYVSLYDLKRGDTQALIHLLWILAASLVISLGSALTMPLQIFDGEVFTKAARGNLCFAIIDTIIFALLVHDPASVGQACHAGEVCRVWPVGWMALAGMHYCYAIDAYTLKYIWS